VSRAPEKIHTFDAASRLVGSIEARLSAYRVAAQSSVSEISSGSELRLKFLASKDKRFSLIEAEKRQADPRERQKFIELSFFFFNREMRSE
jgi:hypothetical protein